MSTARPWVHAAVAVGAVTMATVGIFWPLIFGFVTGEPRFFEWDVPEQYWPDWVYLCSSLAEGELPWWNPYDRGGYPYWQDPQSGAYHPMNWAACAVAGRSPGMGWAVGRVVLSFWLCGLFALGWLRELRFAWVGAIAGAVCLMLAPFMRHNWELNLTLAMAWLPAMLWAAERLARSRRAVDGLVLALAAACCAWVGSPPALWFASTWTFLYLCVRLGTEWWCLGRGILPSLGRALAVAGALSVLWIGVQVIPGMELASHSVQAGRSYASISDGHLDWADTMALLWPQSGNHLYVGRLTLLAVLALFWYRPRRPALWLALVSLPVAVGMALGPAGPLFGLVYSAVPGVHLFRLPHRYEAWMGPASALLVAWCLTALSGYRPRIDRSVLSWVARIVGIVVVCACVQRPIAMAIAAVVLAVVWTAGTAERSWMRQSWGGLVWVAVLLLDLTAVMPSDRHTVAGPPPGGSEVAERVLPQAPGTAVEWRYMDEFGISCRSGTRLGRRDFRGYQDPLLLKSYERVLASLRETPALAEQFNVRYVLSGPHFIHGWNRHFLPPPDELVDRWGASRRDEGVLELANPLPMAYWIPFEQTEQVADRPAALERTKELAPGPFAIFDATRPHRGGEQRVQNGSAKAVHATDLTLARSHLTFQIDAPQAGVVVVNEVWYPGWSATVDGRETPVYRANGLVRALEVEAGSHRVEMRYAPVKGAVLRGLWGLGWLVAGVWLLVWGVRRRRAQRDGARSF